MSTILDNPENEPAPLPPKDQLSGHEYDGIQEYDNPTPGWWVWLFVLSVVFSVFYFVYYHSSVPDRSVYDRYGDSVAADLKKRFEKMGELKISEQGMLEWMANKEYLDGGKAVFKQNCVSCHGAEGQGLVGVNLTDDVYKHVKQLTDIASVVKGGAANGAMPSWTRLHPNEVALVSAYVATLRGKNVSGRAPEGESIAPWPPLPAPKTSTTGEAQK